MPNIGGVNLPVWNRGHGGGGGECARVQWDTVSKHLRRTHRTLAPGDAVRAADFFGNRIRGLPASIAALTSLTRLRLSSNALETSTVAWEAGLYTLPLFSST